MKVCEYKELWRSQTRGSPIAEPVECYPNLIATLFNSHRINLSDETCKLGGRKVYKEAPERLGGYPHCDQYGRVDLEVWVPGFGKTYLHQLCYYHFHADDTCDSYNAFRTHCRSENLDVDHGPQGFMRSQEGVWRSVTDVHNLALQPKGGKYGNCAQGSPLRKRYSEIERKWKQLKKEHNL